MRIYNENNIHQSAETVLAHLKDSELYGYYDRLLAECQRAALESRWDMSEEFALDLLRGFHHLRDDLRVLAGIMETPADPLSPVPEGMERKADEKSEGDEGKEGGLWEE